MRVDLPALGKPTSPTSAISSRAPRGGGRQPNGVSGAGVDIHRKRPQVDDEVIGELVAVCRVLCEAFLQDARQLRRKLGADRAARGRTLKDWSSRLSARFSPSRRRCLTRAAAVGLLLSTSWVVFRASQLAVLTSPDPTFLVRDRHGRYLSEVGGDEATGVGYWTLDPARMPHRVKVEC